MIEEYNKIIDLTFKTGSKSFSIKTPRNGVKPLIEISGELTGKSNVSNIQIEITNFYCDEIEDISYVEINAGYQGKVIAGITAQVQNLYTSTTGPDKVTTINCLTGNYTALMDKSINLKLKAGFTLQDVLEQVSNKLGFETPIIDSSIRTRTSEVPLYHNGLCNSCLYAIKQVFSDINIVIEGSRIKCYPNGKELKSTVVYDLPLLTQAPQYTGGAVSINTIWNPMIKCGEYVHFPTEIKKKSIGSLITDTAMVNLIQFRFSNASDTNEMIISATEINQLGKGGN